MTRYSQMAYEELYVLANTIKKELRKAEQRNNPNEMDVLKSKLIMAQSYMRDEKEIEIGKTYFVTNEEDVTLKVNYLNGVFAWGEKSNDTRQVRGVPFALIGECIER